MCRCARLALIVFTWLAVVPAVAYAQASITGVVRDTSGAVLPGVTIEAASPALIEGGRIAVTDGTGRYRIENLRPGLYTLNFTLPGFSTLRREGIQLTGTFVATTNAELRVGTLEETITVTGETPIVDIQSTARQTVLDQQTVDSLPASRVTNVMVRLLPGVSTTRQDVGGIQGDGVARGSAMVRGNDDARSVSAGGAGQHGASGMSGATSTVSNIAAWAEVVVDTGAISAEQPEGGVIIKLIPRDGGNTFSGRLFANFANSALQGNNFTQELQDRGLRTPNTINRLSEFNPSFGGPIKRDRLWFHWTMRHMSAFSNVPLFLNKNAGDPTKWTYEPDTSRPAANKNTLWSYSFVRTTWQATPKNKLAVAYDPSRVCDCPRGLTATLAPEAAAHNYQLVQRSSLTGEWTAPVTNRVLLEVSVFNQWKNTPRTRENPFLPGSTVRWEGEPGIAGQLGMIAAQEQSTGLNYRARADAHETRDNAFMGRAALSYVTGAHAFKTGFSYRAGMIRRFEFSPDAPMQFRLRDGVPNRITLHAWDLSPKTNLDADHGLFVQDRWTVDRLTLTGGLRVDLLRISYPETFVGPTQFAPARSVGFPATNGLRWQDWQPRIGGVYDLFGDGRTALKASLNKYVRGTAIGSGDLTVVTSEIAPAARLVNTTTRSWNDANRDFVPDCDLLNSAANGECGPMANPNFGGTQAGIAVDPDVLRGWGKRPYNWQFAVGVQRELLPRVSMDIAYWRSWWGNFYVTDDRNVGPADYDAYSITAPVDPRLPSGGGHVISGLYDIKPEKFGVPADNFFTFAHNYGKQTEIWNGVDVTVNARPQSSVLLQGGITTEREATDNCEVVAKLDNPSPLYCHVQGTFLTQVKFLGSYTIPRIDLQVSGVFQSLPGPAIAADYVAPTAEVRPSLGRNLAGGERNVTVNLVEPRTMYGERLNQVDLRIGKILQFGRIRATVSLDLYNALNTSAVLAVSNAFATWQRPQEILPARFAKVGLLLAF